MIFIILLIILIVLILCENNLETFSLYSIHQQYIPHIHFNPIYQSTNFPWWNTMLGNTTNMSYDLRGDPLIIPRTNYVWNNSTIFPIYNRSI
jgi:hypothetical protein